MLMPDAHTPPEITFAFKEFSSNCLDKNATFGLAISRFHAGTINPPFSYGDTGYGETVEITGMARSIDFGGSELSNSQ